MQTPGTRYLRQWAVCGYDKNIKKRYSRKRKQTVIWGDMFSNTKKLTMKHKYLQHKLLLLKVRINFKQKFIRARVGSCEGKKYSQYLRKYKLLITLHCRVSPYSHTRSLYLLCVVLV
jgi:hypothetical protein